MDFGGLAGRAAQGAGRHPVSELDADRPGGRRGVARLCLAGAIMTRDSFYFLFALVWLVIVIGWLLFVTFAG